MHHESVLQLLLYVFIDCPPAVGLSYLGIVLKVSDIPMHYEAVLQLLLSVFIDCPPAVSCSYNVGCAAVVSCSYHLAVLQLSAVLTTRVCNSCQLSYHGTMLYSCQQFIPCG